jgi:HAD superfamily hydrolase (TIGR01509 family)
MIKAIFFDNDGVLVDTEHLYYEATRAVLAEIGAAVSEAQFIDLSLRQGRSVFDLISDRCDAPAIEELRRRRNARYAALLAAGVPPLDGIADVLAALQARARLAVVTSSNPEHFDAIHAGTGLLRFFEFAITNRDYARSKPHPDPYLTALERAGCGAGEAIAIEDSERGLAAARAAGMRCIVVPRGLTRGGVFAGAHRVLADTREIVSALEDLL